MIDQFRGPHDWLSNFFQREIKIGVYTFPSAEHMFAAAKTADMEWQQTIIQAATPAEAKKLGRQCPIVPNWDATRVHVMAYILFQKFYQHADLRQQLINTSPQYLEEGNWWHDNFWGNCKFTYNFQATPCTRCAGITGKNKLGWLLMATRDYFITFSSINA